MDLLHVAFGGLGGHAPVVTTLTKPLSNLGIRSGVITYAEKSALRDNSTAWSEVPVVHPIEVKGRVDFAAWEQVRQLVRELRPRVVLLHTLKLAIPVRAAVSSMRPSGSKSILVEHQAIDLRTTTYNMASGLALPLVASVVYLSDDYRRRYPFRRWPLSSLRHAVVIPNGVETSEFFPVPRANENSEFRIGMAARLTGNKDFVTLLRAIRSLREFDATPPFRLEIAGAGPLRPEIESLSRRLDLRSHVSLVGQVPSHELPAFYQGLTAYVHATHGETASTAILQAMATGLPVVATDVRGVNDLVQHDRTGLLVAPNDPHAMASALGRLQTYAALRTRLGAAGRADVTTRFSADGVAAAYLRLFARIDPSGPWTEFLHRSTRDSLDSAE